MCRVFIHFIQISEFVGKDDLSSLRACERERCVCACDFSKRTNATPIVATDDSFIF